MPDLFAAYAVDPRRDPDDDAFVALQVEIIAALRDAPLSGFGLNWLVIEEAGAFEPRVVIRVAGRRWSLSTLEAALLSLSLRLSPAFRARDLFADALSTASREAEARITRLSEARA